MWPTRRAIFSTGTPASDNSETKLCRSSRGPPHSKPSKLVVPAVCHIGVETRDIDQRQDDNQTGPEQHRSS
jgi:hypothetical protein